MIGTLFGIFDNVTGTCTAMSSCNDGDFRISKAAEDQVMIFLLLSYTPCFDWTCKTSPNAIEKEQDKVNK